MDNYLEINGKYYAVDMDKVVEFIGEDTASVVQAINQTYGIQEDENGFSSGDTCSGWSLAQCPTTTTACCC